ncbi:MAG: C1 family peptidase [Bacteroidales bacterium]|jgi:bleomycin hydrolase
MRKILLITAILFSAGVIAQNAKRDKGVLLESKPGYWKNDILPGVEKYQQQINPPKINFNFKADFSGIDFPNNIDLYKKQWHTPPISQGATGTCWCFSATSFFETEIYRLTKQEIKLSEIYTVYWEYVEKARRYVREKGNSAIGEGSEANAVIRIWKTYGVVPYSSYSGMLQGQLFHAHDKMREEIKSYLQSVKAANAWNEEAVVETIKNILNSYLGIPPTKVVVDGKEMTPQEYLKNVLKINPDDYVFVVSLMEKPFWEQMELPVSDNWWHSKEYYNVPIYDYMKILKQTVKAGYTVAIGGDVSEAGYDTQKQIAVIPTFDIPSDYIDDYSRQFRFSNGTTGDDHGLHLIGYYEKDGKDWYLIKDSGSGSRNNDKNDKNFGYFFYHEDYVKLKMLYFMVHKDMFKDYLSEFKK